MDLDQALTIESATRFLESLRHDAQGRLQDALVSALLAAEAPALLAGLREALARAQADTPELEQRDQAAAQDLAARQQVVGELAAGLWEIPDTPATSDERQAAAAALHEAERAASDAEEAARMARDKVMDNRKAIGLLQSKIMVVDVLPAPDAEVLEVIRGR